VAIRFLIEKNRQKQRRKRKKKRGFTLVVLSSKKELALGAAQ
jgi:hypothetical protein